ncbi:MAG: prepilin-type N-terminal cleavage/methylation domain-containing protein [Nitrospirae bacterium]|nr:prepilin-type N-terminal cleavage/methylation domain-containing protein [Nitrospirota bacterium]
MTKGGFSGESYSRKLFTVHSSPPHPPLSKGGRRGGRGFTLIETIIVMFIVAILAAVVVLKNPFNDIKIYSATRKIAADIRYSQKLSISNQTRAGITFNTNGYSIFQDITVPTAAMSPGDSCSSDSSNNFVVDFTQNRCSTYSGVTLAFSAATIAFDSLGKPVTAAGANLATQTVTVSYPSTTSKTITVEAVTGRVSY